MRGCPPPRCCGAVSGAPAVRVACPRPGSVSTAGRGASNRRGVRASAVSRTPQGVLSGGVAPDVGDVARAEARGGEGAAAGAGRGAGARAARLPLERAETMRLPPAHSAEAALEALEEAAADVARKAMPFRSGLLRLEVHAPRAASALDMIAAMPTRPGTPRAYFAPRAPAGRSPVGATARAEGGGASRVDGAAMAYGSARLIRGAGGSGLDASAVAGVRRWLPAAAPRARAYGAGRFDASASPSEEWASFGAHAFVVPLVEAREAGSQGVLLACHVAWDASEPPGGEHGHATLEAAAAAAADATRTLRRHVRAAPAAPAPLAADWVLRADQVAQQPDRAAWDAAADSVMASLKDGDDALKKVVLARRTELTLERRNGAADAANAAVRLLASLSRRDGDAAYQFLLDMGEDACFVGSTPERLYVRTGTAAASEAVAGTRPRGADATADAELAGHLLADTKENDEFVVVRERVRAALATVSAAETEVVVEEKRGVLRQANVQHLYSRLGVAMRDDAGDAGLLAALHPTPAVCGEPRDAAYASIRACEPFDRGLYAGPIGWLEHGRSEFAVGIRSALVRPSPANPKQMHVLAYAGVGIVEGATPANEWRELDLKTGQIVSQLTQRTPPLRSCLNANTAWALALIDELARNGVRHVCVAPGSRSTPLAAAAAANPLLDVHVAIDERSLAYYALGLSRGVRGVHGPGAAPPAVICTSGTAVANLLPAAWEADNAEVPLLLLTADRPAELVSCSANQAVDQSDILGTKARWHADIPPPDSSGNGMPLRALLTAAAQAVARSRELGHAGPVQLNLRFREPLHPAHDDGWNADALLAGTERWLDGAAPFVRYEGAPAARGTLPPLEQLDATAAALRARGHRGLVVAGACLGAEEASGAAALATALGWPLAADASSGLRLGGTAASTVNALDQILLACEADATLWDSLLPSAVVQVGAPPTSKRTQAMLERVARQGGEWIVVAPSTKRLDFSHLATHRIAASARALADAVLRLPNDRRASPGRRGGYLALLQSANSVTRHALADAIDGRGGEAAEGAPAAELSPAGEPGPEPLTEPWVARYVTSALPRGHGLFLGNSMPIRDVEFYAAAQDERGGALVGDAVAANRGTSGIDGIVSCAAGFAAGLERPCTLLIGDVSFSHDAVPGLQLMRSGDDGANRGENPRRPALTGVVLNNGGGAIFDFLPVSRDDSIESADYRRLWSTPPGLDIAQLCASVGVAHTRCETRAELADALGSAWLDGRSRVVECMVPDSEANRALHARTGALAARASSRVLRAGLGVLRSPDASVPKVSHVNVRPFAIPWARRSTSGDGADESRCGFYLHVKTACGAEGVGECAPLPGLHDESLDAAAAQLAASAELLRDADLDPSLAGLYGGSTAELLSKVLGEPLARALHPSVRAALEGALVEATAKATGVPLVRLLGGSDDREAGVLVSGLVSGVGTPEEAAAEATELVSRGFACLKIKVARREGGADADAQAVLAVRAAVGPDVVLRCDANRGFSPEDARRFGERVKGASLEYVEEPLAAGVGLAEEVVAFARATGVPVALDETLDEVADTAYARHGALGPRQFRQALPWATRDNGIVAAVIKPSRLGGMSAAAAALEWAQSPGVDMRGVLSSAFDTGVALGQHATLARCLCDGTVHHGLWTHEWLPSDPSAPEVVRGDGDGGGAARLSCSGKETVASAPVVLDRSEHMVEVEPHDVAYRMRVTEWRYGPPSADGTEAAAGDEDVLVLLHGFLGTGSEWDAVAHATAASWHARAGGDAQRRLRILAPDLPGHGASRVAAGSDLSALSIEGVAEAVLAAVELLAPGTSARRALVGYSMGGRIALRLALHRPSAFARGAVAVSASPGLRSLAGPEAEARAAGDARRAAILRRCVSASSGNEGQRLREFARAWYAANDGMWRVFRAQPGHVDLVHSRCGAHDPNALADAIEGASPARMDPLWGALAMRSADAPPLVFLAGECDTKYVSVSRTAAEAASAAGSDATSEIVARCDHALHAERPDVIAGHAAALLVALE